MQPNAALGAHPHLAAEALERAALGQSFDQAQRALRAMFPELGAAVRDAAYRAALAATGGAAVLARANRGQMASPARLMGCDTPGAFVRISMSITETDHNSGMTRRHYVDAIDLPASGRMGDIIMGAFNAVVADARSHGYDVRQRSGRAGQPAWTNATYTIHSAECIEA